ncbi:MIP/aquaporin family protein [Telmatospirillum siberiense]|uniref:Aquaporin n=1 Tax=Telmatospirillum siberiense TaxID=382514 RepID=A0A2N3PUL3_9PROT|nr:MIP/aquaporin family protein [Telmatospirillum siberiense]PKU24086.1 aquaporin [Telmatospirillum siberiense]
MNAQIFGEFFGTMVLIGLGDSTVANVLLAKSKAENSGWIVITTGWGMAVLFGVLTSLAVGGVAHLNPAVTLALAIGSGDYSNVVPFIAAQMVGAFCGAVLVWLIFLSHWGETADQGLKLAVFCTGPAIRNIPRNALTEVIGTMFLIIAGFAIGSKGVAASGLPAGFGPYLWGMLVWALGLALGGPTGYAINPARDLGPRIAHQLLPIAGKGDSDWGYAAVPVVAPLIGGVLGAIVCKATGIF